MVLGCLTYSNDFRMYEPSLQKHRRFEYAGSRRVSKKFIQCPFPFRQPIVFWDGTVVGCEYDSDLEMTFGKIGEQHFSEIWNSSNAIHLRKSIMSGKKRTEFCMKCPYQDRTRRGVELFCKELKPAF